MASVPSEHAPGAVPWADQVLFHADVGPELHTRLPIKPLVALIGTCKAAGDAITFKPADAQAALATHGKKKIMDHAESSGDLRLLRWAGAQGCKWEVSCWWRPADMAVRARMLRLVDEVDKGTKLY